jgi:glycogen debranching enzyme
MVRLVRGIDRGIDENDGLEEWSGGSEGWKDKRIEGWTSGGVKGWIRRIDRMNG